MLIQIYEAWWWWWGGGGLSVKSMIYVPKSEIFLHQNDISGHTDNHADTMQRDLNPETTSLS